MKIMKEKSKLLRKNFKKHELKSKIFKNIQANSLFVSLIRWNSIEKYSHLGKCGTKTSINDRCIVTTSKKSFNKKFKLSRLEFLRNAKAGKISGFRKAIW